MLWVFYKPLVPIGIHCIPGACTVYSVQAPNKSDTATICTIYL